MHEKEAEVVNSRYLQPQPLIDDMQHWMVQHGVPPLDAPSMSRGSMGMLDKVAPRMPDVELKGGEASQGRRLRPRSDLDARARAGPHLSV